jgi:anti-sigma regulatory factor (Ser/Thr protein kinase)
MRRRYVLTALDDIKSVATGVINGVSRIAPLNDERRYNIALILNELLVNSFEHAKPSPRTPVFVHAEYSGGSLHIGVTDGGAGFEHARQLSPAEEVDAILSERGRGLKLVRALCSDICYNDHGNSVEVSIAL